jgi:hypothetical protein
VIAGASTEEGPVIGTVTIPYPNVRSWHGEVPPGEYYVSVISQFHTAMSVRSNSTLVVVR